MAETVSVGATWGISGPTFLLLFAALGAATAAAASAVRRRLVGGQVEPDRLRALGPYEVAYLRGGPRRVKLAVLDALVQRGELRVESSRLKPVGEASVLSHRLETEAAAEVSRGYASEDQRRVWGAYGMRYYLDKDLHDMLAVTPQQEIWARWVVAVVWVPLFGLGLARAIVGGSRGRPIQFLVLEMMVAAIVMTATIVLPLERTRRAVVAGQLRGVYPVPRLAAGWQGSGTDLATMSVALLGFSAIAETDRPVFAALTRRESRFGDDFGGGGGGGGCGCGGGGGCGG